MVSAIYYCTLHPLYPASNKQQQPACLLSVFAIALFQCFTLCSILGMFCINVWPSEIPASGAQSQAVATQLAESGNNAQICASVLPKTAPHPRLAAENPPFPNLGEPPPGGGGISTEDFFHLKWGLGGWGGGSQFGFFSPLLGGLFTTFRGSPLPVLGYVFHHFGILFYPFTGSPWFLQGAMVGMCNPVVACQPFLRAAGCQSTICCGV